MSTAAFRAALARPHNAPVTPFLPRSVAQIRKASYEAIKDESIKKKPNNFRSKRPRK
jgi:hypothetical protein